MTIGTMFAAMTGCAPLTPYRQAVTGLPQDDFLTYRGRQVHVVERGAGPSLLLLHGFAASTYSFHRLIPYLAEHFRVVALDYYGFGYTERPQERDHFGIEAQLDLIRHVLEVKKMGPSTVLGQSYGGTLALLLAQTDPARVERLVLVSAIAEFGDPPLWVRFAPGRWAGYPASRWLLSSPPRFRAALGRAYYPKETLTAEVAEGYRRPLLIEGLPRAYFAFTAAMGNGTSPGLRLSQVSAPVLVVAGAHDEIVPLAQSERLAATLPSARLLVLRKSGHSSPEEVPEALAAAVREFAAAEPAGRP